MQKIERLDLYTATFIISGSIYNCYHYIVENRVPIYGMWVVVVLTVASIIRLYSK